MSRDIPSTALRLAQGGHIQRDHDASFVFDGELIPAFAGDTLASALLAAGKRIVARSFKYHRPRGIVSAGIDEPNALVTLGSGTRRTPNLAATVVEAELGLEASSQNASPTVRWDWRGLHSWASPLFGAGFYYKTFMGPWRNTRAWMFFEEHIRRAAGLGRSNTLPDAAHYEHQHDFVDVLVVGSGKSGLSAALDAARAGHSVLVVEQDFMLGGQQLLHAQGSAEALWLANTLAELQSLAHVQLLTRSTAFGLYDSQTAGVLERSAPAWQTSMDTAAVEARLHIVRYTRIVLACGALERPLVFAGNDRPGVMQASALGTYIARYAVLPAQRLLFAVNNDAAWQHALCAAKAGAQVHVADMRPLASIDPALRSQAQQCQITVHSSTCIVQAEAQPGAAWLPFGPAQVRSAQLAQYEHGHVGALQARLEVDVIGVSGGYSPTVHLAVQRGEKPQWDARIHSFVPATVHTADSAISCRGRMTGSGLADQTLATALVHRQAHDKAFVDFQHDVHLDDISLAQQEGYNRSELLKRYTTAGMATDQGKSANMAVLAEMARFQGLSVPEIGHTTFRPPYSPVSLGALAGPSVGAHYRPIRRTAMEAWHLAHGAEWVQAGLWQRANWYRRNGHSLSQAYVREMDFVRHGTGIADVSTLGKIDVQGPDAAQFLDRVYSYNFSNLSVGKARYGLMLREDGIVLDDGTTSRISAHHYFLTTTTAQAARVMSHLEWLLQVVWPDLRVVVSSSTDQWAAMSIAGRNSRALLQAAFPDLDVSNEALPHMGLAHTPYQYHDETTVLRCIRLSFSGELAYEIYAPYHAGLHVWEHLLQVGHAFGLKVYGLEALASLRIEKGHVTGSELDGRTSAKDIGLNGLMSRKKAFWGQALAQRPHLQKHDRPSLIGLEALDENQPPANGHILFFQGDAIQGVGRGHISSSCYSAEVGKSIALGFLQDGANRIGETVIAVSPVHQRQYLLRVTQPCFLDATGSRYAA